MLVNDSISNLVNGVSQQPDALRLMSQCANQVNCYSSVVEGLKNRPPTEWLAKIFSGTLGDAFMHNINRDVTERYIVTIIDDDLFVHDLAGVAKTVNFPDGKAYLNASMPSTAFQCLTIADYTFIVNKTIPVAMASTLTANRGFEGLVFVKAGQYGSTYKVFVNGTQQAIYTTSTTDVTTLRTNDIADSLKTQLITNLGGTWTITRGESVVHIKKNDGGDFDLLTEDSQGGASLQTFKDKTQRFTELPTVAPDGFRIMISGDPDSEFDNYYLAFSVNNLGVTFDAGTWEETVQQGIPYKLDAATMPYVLVRESNGTFTFKKATWSDRTVGDEDSAVDPSFVGSTINDLFFFKNRLWFLSDENSISSEVGIYFNFFLTTVVTLLDSDPIDGAAPHVKVSIMRHAVPFDQNVMQFSDQTQFFLKGGATITPKSVAIDPVTEYESALTAHPIGVGRFVYFATNKGNFNGVREFFIDTATENKDANDITGHVPAYIPKGIFKFAASTVEDVLVCLTTGEPSSMFVYKYFFSGQDKLQSAWFKCTFGTGTKVLNVTFIETIAYLAVQRSDGVYLERMDFSPSKVDDNTATALHRGYVTHLDRRITDTNCTSVVYNAGTNETTFTLPYPIDGTMQIVTRATNPQVGTGPGVIKSIKSQGSNTLVVSGNYSTQPVWIGQVFECRYQFSTFYLRENKPQGGSGIIASGRLQIRTVSIVYDESGYFEVHVTPRHRSTSIYRFTGRVIGDGNNVLGEVALRKGRFNARVFSKNEDATIEIVSSSFMPFHVTSAEWEGFYVSRSRRV